jgi:uncharacterized membrane protein YkoI
MMRRALAIAASVAVMLAAGEPAMTQTPNSQPQPKMQIQPNIQVQPRIQQPSRPPNLPLIKPSQALIIALRAVPNSKAVGVKLLPEGNYAVTLKRNNQVQRVIIDGDTGAPH